MYSILLLPGKFVGMFQKLSCLSYVLFLFLPPYSLLKCFRSSHACHNVFSCVLACVWSVQLFQKLSCLPHVFGSVLACAKSAHVFQKLSYSLFPQ